MHSIVHETRRRTDWQGTVRSRKEADDCSSLQQIRLLCSLYVVWDNPPVEDLSFVVDDRGLVWVEAAHESVIPEALNDCVSSLSPRGQDVGLSTFWIGHVLQGLESAPSLEPHFIGGGNSSALVLDGNIVRAESLYETYEPELISVDDLRRILLRWRHIVLQLVDKRGTDVSPDQVNYQRNPPRSH